MVLLVLFGLMAIGGILALRYGYRKHDREGGDQGFGEMAIGIFFIIIPIIVVLSISLNTYVSSNNEIYKMKVFQNHNLPEMQRAIEEIREGIPMDDLEVMQDWILDASNLQQIQDYRALVEDRRDAIIAHNTQVERYTRWQDNWFNGLFWSNLPEDITYIG